ncbi:MAG: pilus assembly protein CpaB [Paracoccaceae bacterium]|jgi:pilus assembly protein CpaB
MLRIAIILVALSLGGAAAWIVVSQGAVTDVAGVPVAVPIPTMDVLVAATDVPSGAALIPENLVWQAWPSSAVGPSFITQASRPSAPSEMLGMIVRSNLIAGEPMQESRLVGNGAGFLSVMLATNMRAVAVPVSAETSAGGFILPNDHVDVMETFRVPSGPSAGQTSSRVLLRNVRVLAIDQMAAPQDGDFLVGKTATLEIYENQVAMITSAAASGTLSLVLRSLADNAELSAPPATDSIPAASTRTISIYRTNSIELMEVEAITLPSATSP